MNCEDADNLISARVDVEISSDDRAHLERHLEACARCRTTADAIESLDAGLDRAFAGRRDGAAAVAERVLSEFRAAGDDGARVAVASPQDGRRD